MGHNGGGACTFLNGDGEERMIMRTYTSAPHISTAGLREAQGSGRRKAIRRAREEKKRGVLVLASG